MRRCIHTGQRCLAVLLMVCICAGSISLPVTAYSFSDVNRDDNLVRDYFDAINWVSDNGYMIGTSANVFSPHQFVTRAMALTVLWRYAGEPDPVNWSNPFGDVSASSYYYKAVLWAVENQITNGTSSTAFSPNALVNWGQALTFLLRYAKMLYGNDIYSFEDISLTVGYQDYPAYIKEALRWAVSNGIILMDEPICNLYGLSPVYRKQLAIFLNRYSSNVDGIRNDKDKYSFSNSSSNYESGQQNPKYYMITGQHFAKLHAKLNTASYIELRDAINEAHLSCWGGACYGMSLSCILDKLGKIGFNECCANACDSVYQIPSLRQYTSSNHVLVRDNVNLDYFAKAESGIHYYQLSYQQLNYYEMIILSSGGIIYEGSFLHNDISDFIVSRSHCCLSLFSFFWEMDSGNVVGHSVVVYGHPYRVGNIFRYHVYDPSDPDTSVWLIADLESDSIYLSNATDVVILYAEYLNNFEFSNCTDLDGDGNNAG